MKRLGYRVSAAIFHDTPLWCIDEKIVLGPMDYIYVTKKGRLIASCGSKVRPLTDKERIKHQEEIEFLIDVPHYGASDLDDVPEFDPEYGDALTREDIDALNARLLKSLEQSRKGETVDLGDFTQYAGKVLVTYLTREDGTPFWSVTLDEDEIIDVLSVLDYGPRGFTVLEAGEGEYALIMPEPDMERLKTALVLTYPGDEIVFLPRYTAEELEQETQTGQSVEPPYCGGCECGHSVWLHENGCTKCSCPEYKRYECGNCPSCGMDYYDPSTTDSTLWSGEPVDGPEPEAVFLPRLTELMRQPDPFVDPENDTPIAYVPVYRRDPAFSTCHGCDYVRAHNIAEFCIDHDMSIPVVEPELPKMEPDTTYELTPKVRSWRRRAQ